MLRFKWKTDEESVTAFTMVKQDYPYETAEYILQHKVGTSEHKYATGCYTQWACAYMQQCKQTFCHIIWLSGGDIIQEFDIVDGPIISTDSSPDQNLLFIQCTNVSNTVNKKHVGKQMKPGWISSLVLQVKYSVIIPHSVKHVMELDTENGNTLWADAIKKEIDSFLWLRCFDFCAPDFKFSSEYQFVKLIMKFEVKQDGQCKARLWVVAGGHMVKLRGISSQSAVVKSISIRLLDLIAHHDSLKT